MAGSHRARLVLLGAIGLVLALAAPASATGQLPPPEWSPAHCATGAITEVRHDVDRSGKPAFWMSGWIQPCAGTGYTDGFRVIRYHGDGGRRDPVVPYQSASAPTSFTFLVDNLRFALSDNMTAVCVAYDYEGRAACLGVDVGDRGERPVVTPIPTDDPRVLVGSSRGAEVSTNPTCGTCL